MSFASLVKSVAKVFGIPLGVDAVDKGLWAACIEWSTPNGSSCPTVAVLRAGCISGIRSEVAPPDLDLDSRRGSPTRLYRWRTRQKILRAAKPREHRWVE